MTAENTELDHLFGDIGQVVDSDRQLNWSLKFRKDWIEKRALDENGNVKPPEDTMEASVLKGLLDSMDRISLARLRAKQEDKGMAVFSDIAVMLADNKDVLVSNSPELGEIVDVPENASISENMIPEFNYAEGENEVAPPPMDWQSFSAEMEEKLASEE